MPIHLDPKKRLPKICGYCKNACLFNWIPFSIGEDKIIDRSLWIYMANCPNCDRALVMLLRQYNNGIRNCADVAINVLPGIHVHKQAPSEVPQEVGDDYNEACKVIPYSAKASAALSRRCLQLTLRLNGFNQYKLVDQIAAAVPTLPSELGSNLDYVRKIGNFAAHAEEVKDTGTIIPVNPGEAEWCVKVLLELFDHYFVKPSQHKREREEFDAKLLAAGKKSIKTETS